MSPIEYAIHENDQIVSEVGGLNLSILAIGAIVMAIMVFYSDKIGELEATSRDAAFKLLYFATAACLAGGLIGRPDGGMSARLYSERQLKDPSQAEMALLDSIFRSINSNTKLRWWKSGCAFLAIASTIFATADVFIGRVLHLVQHQ